MFDFSNLENEDTLVWLRVFSQSPFEEIIKNVEAGFRKQIAESRLTEFVVTGKPDWLTAASEQLPGEAACTDGKTTVTRLAVAFPCYLVIEGPARSSRSMVSRMLRRPAQRIGFDHTGVFTWVVNGLHQKDEHHQRFWLDLEGTIEDFGSSGKLRKRIFLDSLAD